MSQTGWRTAVIGEHEKLSFRDGQLVITDGEQETALPVCQLARVMLGSPEGSITLPLLNELAGNRVSVLLCDEKRIPRAELLPLLPGSGSGGIQDQAAWSEARKDLAWAQIVRNKIDMQCGLLERLSLPEAAALAVYAADVLVGDVTNREGQAARLYFSALFGPDFVRHALDETNAALDYGYAILRSAVSRAIALHGCTPALGICHCSRANPVNLSCDLMQPFRPIVDRIVVSDPYRTLTAEYKKQLIALTQQECVYGSQRMNVDNAIQRYVSDVLRFMQQPEERIGVVRFA